MQPVKSGHSNTIPIHPQAILVNRIDQKQQCIIAETAIEAAAMWTQKAVIYYQQLVLTVVTKSFVASSAILIEKNYNLSSMQITTFVA